MTEKEKTENYYLMGLINKIQYEAAEKLNKTMSEELVTGKIFEMHTIFQGGLKEIMKNLNLM